MTPRGCARLVGKRRRCRARRSPRPRSAAACSPCPYRYAASIWSPASGIGLRFRLVAITAAARLLAEPPFSRCGRNCRDEVRPLLGVAFADSKRDVVARHVVHGDGPHRHAPLGESRRRSVAGSRLRPAGTLCCTYFSSMRLPMKPCADKPETTGSFLIVLPSFIVVASTSFRSSRPRTTSKRRQSTFAGREEVSARSRPAGAWWTRRQSRLLERAHPRGRHRAARLGHRHGVSHRYGFPPYRGGPSSMRNCRLDRVLKSIEKFQQGYRARSGKPARSS